MDFMDQIRSFRDGEVSREEFEEAAECFDSAYPANQVRLLAEQMDSLTMEISSSVMET